MNDVVVDYQKEVVPGVGQHGFIRLSVNGGDVVKSEALSDDATTGFGTPEFPYVEVESGDIEVTVSAHGNGEALLNPKDAGLGVKDETNVTSSDKITIGLDEALKVGLAGGDVAIGGSIHLVGVGTTETAKIALYLGTTEVATQVVSGVDGGKLAISLNGFGAFDTIAVSTVESNAQIGFDRANLQVIDESFLSNATLAISGSGSNGRSLQLDVDGETDAFATANNPNFNLSNRSFGTNQIELTVGNVNATVTGSGNLTITDNQLGIGVGPNDAKNVNGSETITVAFNSFATSATVHLSRLVDGESGEVVAKLNGEAVATFSLESSTESEVSSQNDVHEFELSGALFDELVFSATSGNFSLKSIEVTVVDPDAVGSISIGQVGNKNQLQMKNSFTEGKDETIYVGQNRSIEQSLNKIDKNTVESQDEMAIAITALDSSDSGKHADKNDRTWWDQGEGLGIADGNDGNSIARKGIDGDEMMEISLNGYLATSASLDLAKFFNLDSGAEIHIAFVLNGKIVDADSVFASSIGSLGSHTPEVSFTSSSFFDSILISTAPVSQTEDGFVVDAI